MFNNKFDAVCNYSKKKKGVVRRILSKLPKRRNNVQWAEGKKDGEGFSNLECGVVPRAAFKRNEQRRITHTLYSH